MAYDRLERALDVVDRVTRKDRADRVRDADEATESGEHGQHDQGNRHYCWRFAGFMHSMGMISVVRVMLAGRRVAKSLAAKERHYHQASHVYAGEQSGESADEPQYLGCPARQRRQSCTKELRAKSSPENFILREEAGPDRNSANSQPAHQHGGKGDG